MTRYFYSVVRCVPSPRTGEFLNIAAIAGSEESDEWSIRQIQNESRAKKLCSADDLGVVHEFLASAWETIDQHNPEALLVEQPLTLEWLQGLHHDHRNVVQLSEPMPILGESVEGVLDTIFERLLIDPVRGQRGFITKHRVLAALRDSFEEAEIPASLWLPKAEIYVGNSVHALLDFAIGNGQIVQLSQAWSFQRASVTELSTEVKSWGYALSRLRLGDGARLVGQEGRLSAIRKDVAIDVLCAPPATTLQEQTFEEARQVFNDIGAELHMFGDEGNVGRKAKSLLTIE
jgi:hypothetical protein